MNRFVELALVGCLFLLSAPIQAVVALLVALQLGRPIMFRQERVGRAGRTIMVPKLRSMTDARDASGALLPDHARQTGFTRILRRLRLDELPQLWAILDGRMALVGPRPLLASTLAEFGVLADRRNEVRPGLTGWAQVSGNTRLSDVEKMALDLWYVAHRSTALDLRIIGETVGVALRGEHRDEQRVTEALGWVRSTYPALNGVQA